jgi:hypothetical protein
MKVSAEESLWLSFPILLVVIALVIGIIYLGNTNTDVRSRASQPTPTPATIPLVTPTAPITPEVACNDIYQPVCGLNNKTYANPCEANQDGVITFSTGACIAPTKIILPNTP